MFLDQNPRVRTLVSLSVTNLHFSVSVSITLFIISNTLLTSHSSNLTMLGVAWLFYRPLLSLLLVSVGALPHLLPLVKLWLRDRARYRA